MMCLFLFFIQTNIADNLKIPLTKEKRGGDKIISIVGAILR
ncbi:hypothetical protein IIS_05256 [Bacillus cereus VD131]|nr:hypothetical protein IIS_05256 [Bacillus cereus VD131]